MKSVIETSLEHFLEDTEFPYDASQSSSGDGMGAGGGGGQAPEGMGDGEKPEGMGEGEAPEGMEDGQKPGVKTDDESSESGDDASSEQSYEEMDDITRTDSSSGLDLSGTYETAQDYIDALNAESEWVTYDESTGKVSITDIASFVKALKSSSKNLGAFDQLDGRQGENTLFGYGDGEGAHFDEALSDILSELDSEYTDSYAEDLTKKDDIGNTVDVRLSMYTPLYYLLESEDGYQSSSVAKYWRICTGINQGDCALSTEMNLALALMGYDGVESVDLETVWGQGHTQAERTGDSTSNFIAWVNECMGK